MTTILQSIAKRISVDLIGGPHESHDNFPTYITDGIQSSSGASSESLMELNQFIHQLFIFQLPKNFFIQMAVAGAFICILVIVGLATIYSRICQRAFWVFKATRRSEGVYLVPNALNTFLLFEGVFAFCWLAFVIVQYEGYWRQEGAMQRHIATFNLIIWWPLWIGAFMAGWGSFYTAPGALDKGPLRSHGWVRFLPRPLMINIFCVGTPLILIVSLIPLIVLSQTHLNQAFDQYKIFSSQIQAAISAAGTNSIAASPQQANQFLSNASEIWDMQVRTGYYLAVGYAIWPVWAAVFLIFYTPSGGYLVYLVWTQLRRQKRVLVELREKYIEEEAIERRKRELAIEDQIALGYHPYPKVGRNNSMLKNNNNNIAMRQIISLGEVSGLPDPSTSLLFQPLTSSQERETTAVPENGLTPPVTPSTVVQGRISHIHNDSNENGKESSEDSKEDVFFPALRPEMQKLAGTKRLSSVGGTPYSRYKYLRRCFINLSVLYVAIVLGAALYLGVSASLARYLYSSYRKGPKELTHIIYYACVISAWGAVVFGSCCILAILARFIDPANGPGMGSTGGGKEEEKGAGGYKGFTRKTISASGTGLKNKLSITTGSPYQEKTRTMPAVPESVGATMDELMSGISNADGISFHQQQTRSFGAASSRRQRGNSLSETEQRLAVPRSRTLKFDLHPRPEGGLLLEPSNESMGGFVSTAASSFVEEEGTMAAPSGRILKASRMNQIQRKRHLPYITPLGQTVQMQTDLDGSNNSSQRSLASRRKYSMTEPTSAPPPPPPKPLAPSRTPPLSPEYVAFMQGMSEGYALKDQHASKSKILSPSPPPRSSSFIRYDDNDGDNEEEQKKQVATMPVADIALLSGLPSQVLLDNKGIGLLSSPEIRSFSSQRKAKGQEKSGLTIGTINKPLPASQSEQHSPSIAISPISYRRSGLHSNVSPYLPPSSGLPPTPTSATAFTDIASDALPPGSAQQIYTDRQKIPIQSQDWTPLAQGWFRIPQDTVPMNATEDDQTHSHMMMEPIEMDDLPDMNVLSSPRRPSLPLPEAAMMNTNSHPINLSRRRSEANNASLFF